MSLKKIASVVLAVACVVTCRGTVQAQPIDQSSPTDLSSSPPQDAVDAWNMEPDSMAYFDSELDSCGSDYDEGLSSSGFGEAGEYCSSADAGPAENAEPPAVAECCSDIGGEHYYVASVEVRATITWLGREIVRDQGCQFFFCQHEPIDCGKVEAACRERADAKLKKEVWYKFATIKWSVLKACEITGHTCPSSIPAAPETVKQMW